MNIFSARFELLLGTVTIALAGYLGQTVYPDFKDVSLASLLADARHLRADEARTRPAFPGADGKGPGTDRLNARGRLSCAHQSEQLRAACATAA